MKTPKHPTLSGRFEFSDNGKTVKATFYVNDDFFFIERLAKDAAEYPGSFEKFKSGFIASMQDEILIYVGNSGQAIASENHIADFWTALFIERLNNALRRTHKRLKRSFLFDLYLSAAWKQSDLCKMNRCELAAHLNEKFKLCPPITPAAAWKLLERLNLFSSRNPGPKPRKTN